MSDLRPGKGFFGDATYDSVNFIQEALYDVITVFQSSYGPDDVDGDAWIDEGHAEDLLKALLKLEGWEPETDKFGKKAFKLIDWGEGAYRVTLVLTGQGSLKLDIRQWYIPQ